MDSGENRSSATFNLVIKNFVSLNDQGVYSLPCMIRNIPWKLRAYKDSQGSPSLAVFLYCKADEAEWNYVLHEFWNCSAKFKLIILNHNGQDKDFSCDYDHVFHSGATQDGSAGFMSWNLVTNRQKGYLKDDTVIIRAEVAVDIPLGIECPLKENNTSELLESKKKIHSLELEVARLKTDLANEKSQLGQLKIDFSTEKADTSSKIKILETLVTNLVLQISELKKSKESASQNMSIDSSGDVRDALLLVPSIKTEMGPFSTEPVKLEVLT